VQGAGLCESSCQPSTITVSFSSASFEKEPSACAEQNLLRERIAVIARTRSMNRAPWRHKATDGADARAAVPFCFQSLRPARSLVAFLSLCACRGEVQRSTNATLRAEGFDSPLRRDRVGQLDLPDFLAFQIDDIYDRHFSSSFVSQNRSELNSYFAFFAAFCALLMKMLLPVRPGPEPARQQVFITVHFQRPSILCGHARIAHVTGNAGSSTRGTERTAADAARLRGEHRPCVASPPACANA